MYRHWLAYLKGESPPTRGAWIEISDVETVIRANEGRPPHGGRGLKYIADPVIGPHQVVAPHTGGVD